MVQDNGHLALKTAIVAVLALCAASELVAARQARDQSATSSTPQPTFDVASIKPNRSVDTRRSGALQPGRFLQTNVTLLQLIQQAYPGQILGGPSWVDSDRFDVDAKGSFDLTSYLPTADRSKSVYMMLRALLADRFRLKVHSESRELPVYALELVRSDGKLGPELRRVDVDCLAVMSAIASGQPRPPVEPGKPPLCGSGGGVGHVFANGVSMPQFAGMVVRFVNRPVVDRTGLSGYFVLDLQWTPDQPPTSGPPALPGSATTPTDPPSIFSALQEQLGLKLESTRGPVDVVVIDHAEHPTDD